jgi:ASC-1-like (ASCH) protein
MHHALKIERVYLQRIISGEKTFEIRKNDRDYQAGDTVCFSDKPAQKGEKFWCADIGYVSHYEQKEGYVVFSLLNVRKK